MGKPNQITDAMFKAIIPHCPASRRAEVLPLLNQTCEAYDITTELRVAAFLATLAVESAEFRYTSEIASGAAYEGRKDLGNVKPGDGKRYKGHGNIQITGRANHSSYTTYLRDHDHLPFIDFVGYPDKLAEQPYALDSAGWFFAVFKNCNQLADQRQFLATQIKVNGKNKKTGLPNNWPERKAYYETALRALPDDLFIDIDTPDVLPDDKPTDIHDGPDPEPVETPVANPQPDTPANNSEVTIGADGSIQASSSSDGKKDVIAIEKPAPKNFIQEIRTKIGAAIGGNVTISLISEKIQEFKSLGLPEQFAAYTILIVAIGSVIWLLIETVKWVLDRHRDQKITDSLISANSTATNVITLVDTDKIAAVEAAGATVVRR